MNACRWGQQYGPLIGRLLLANIFLVSGFKKFTNTGFVNTTAYMAAKMPSLDLNLIKLMLIVTIAIELVGGLMMLLGWQARSAAFAIFLWMIPVTIIFHAYWGLPPEVVQMQFIQFQKNLAIMGGLLYIVAFGAGPYSLGRDRC